jgi:hypothetical protein
MAAKELEITPHRAILKDPKDSLKLLPWTHRLIANAKAVISGPHRGVSEKHLQRYLTEVCYRFNRRFWDRQSFHRLLNICALLLEMNLWQKLLSRVKRPLIKIFGFTDRIFSGARILN